MAKKITTNSTLDSHKNIPYPKHEESFLKYYNLGESRTLLEAAKKRYQELLIESKKREDRRRQGGITFSKDENRLRLLALRALIRDALDVFSYKVDLHIQVKKALVRGDIEKAQELNEKLNILGRVDMENFESVEAMVDLYDKINDIIKNRSSEKIS